MELDLIDLAIILALVFDFINGFHDSANAIATVVATRVLTPAKALMLAGFFNFVGPFIFSLAVARTVGSGIIDQKQVTTTLIIGGLLGAIVWNLITWWLGLPSSSSHALVGGLMGAALAAAGTQSVLWPTSVEWLALGRLGFIGAVLGLAFGLVMVPWSRVQVHRALMPVFIFAGAVSLLYYSFNHTDYVRDFAKGILVNIVFLVFGGIMGAFLWVTSQQRMDWRLGPKFALPGAAGAIAVATLLNRVTWDGDLVKLGGITKVIVFMFVSPVLGFFMGFLFYTVLQWTWRNAQTAPVHRWSRRLQLGSSSFYALTHGTNDAQKTMGIIAVLLTIKGVVPATGTLIIPPWVIFASAAAMGLGTTFGGWRIIKTMAARITHLRPDQGFAAETAGGVVLVAMAEAGIPVSTTHAISSSIMGVGAVRRRSAVRWSVGRQMFMAWIITIPASGLVAAVTYWTIDGILKAFF